ncbi:ABC transporter permease [Glycomyces tarimensis]
MTTANLRSARPARPAWSLLAAAEFRLIARNRTVLISATIVPVVFALVLIEFEVGYLAAPGALAAMQLVFLQLFGVFMTVTMTLAARRQQLYLQRLRTSPASTAAVVAGLTVPLVLLVLPQTVFVFGVTSAVTGTFPEHPVLLAAGFALCSAMMIGFGFLTAAFTSSPESAQFTALPGFFAVMGGMTWAQTTEPENLGIWHLLVPGGAPAALVRAAWEGPVDWPIEIVLAIVAGAAVAAAVALLAARVFRWQPRA